MGPTTSIIAGLAVVGAGVAVYRFARKKTAEIRKVIDGLRSSGAAGSVMDFEKDPSTGVYRPRG